MCELAEDIQVTIVEGPIAARDAAPPNSGREGIATYSSALREVELDARAAFDRAQRLELPPGDVLPFHRAQIRSVELLIENLDLFAADMESFLVTDDVEALHGIPRVPGAG